MAVRCARAITFDYRAYAQHIDKLSEWAAELSKARVDVITTVGDLAIRAAQEATKPFLSLRSQTIWSNRLVTQWPATNGTQRGQHPCDRARRHRVASGAEIAAIMAQASGAAALNVLASLMLYANRQLIIDRVAAVRLPGIYQWPETADEGGFVATDRVSLTYGEMFYLDGSRSSRSRGKPSHTVRGPGSAANPRCPWSCLNGPPNHLPHQTTCPRSPRARDLLAPVYGWFTEGFDTVDFLRHSGIAHSISLNKAVAACSFQGTAHASRIFH